MTFQEPVTSALMDTKLVSVLYDLNSEESTAKALGSAFPAQSLIMSPEYIGSHPLTVQHLVNAFVKAMRFINRHNPDEIAAALPPSYFTGKDHDAAVRFLRNTLRSFAKNDYSITPEAAQLDVSVLQSSQFDSSEEGQWRAGGSTKVRSSDLYDNTFVMKAMDALK